MRVIAPDRIEASGDEVVLLAFDGTRLFVSPGIQYVIARLLLMEFSVQLPVFNRPNGRQLGTDFAAGLGVRILLF